MCILDHRIMQISFLHLYNKYKIISSRDIGMANYEKQVEQEAAYPIPISLYNCYRTVRHEKRGIAITLDSVSHASLSCNSSTNI